MFLTEDDFNNQVHGMTYCVDYSHYLSRVFSAAIHNTHKTVVMVTGVEVACGIRDEVLHITMLTLKWPLVNGQYEASRNECQVPNVSKMAPCYRVISQLSNGNLNALVHSHNERSIILVLLEKIHFGYIFLSLYKIPLPKLPTADLCNSFSLITMLQTRLW
jgi:hypothetical protein